MSRSDVLRSEIARLKKKAGTLANDLAKAKADATKAANRGVQATGACIQHKSASSLGVVMDNEVGSEEGATSFW